MRQIPSDQQKSLMRWLKASGKSQRKAMTTLTALALTAFVVQLVLFWQLAKSTQTLIVDNQRLATEHLVGLGITMLVLLTVERVRMVLSERAESTLFAELQQRFFDRLSSGQYAMVRQHSTYFWQQIWLNHLPVVAQFNAHYLVQQRFAMAVPLIVLACVFPLNWLVGVAMVMSLPVVPLFMIVIGKGTSVLHQKHFKALSRLGSIFVDRIKALELLRIFNAHDAQSNTLATASDSLNQRTMRVVGVAFLSATVLDFFSTLAVALVAVFVGFNLLGEFTIGGQLTLHTGLFLLLTAPLCFAELKQLGRLYHLRSEAIAVADTLMPILETKADATTLINANDFNTIEWEQMKVSVPELHAEKVTLKKCDRVWLKGASGSGKTCFLEALMGQRQTTHALTNAVLISQHAVILPATVRENLALGKAVDDDALHQALAQVELDEWLARQTDGLDTVLDEQVPLSGGQQQRLALARVLLSDAQVILLDEPTAHLTDEQHQRLSQMIRGTLSKRTVIWASHKPLDESWFTQGWLMKDRVMQS